MSKKNIKLNEKEKTTINNLISSYADLYKKLATLEEKIEEASKKQKDLMMEYDYINSELLLKRSEEMQFFQIMKKKYPNLKNLKELIE